MYFTMSLWDSYDVYLVKATFVTPTDFGDYNQDGKVDAADYVVFRHTLGQTGFGLAADGNGNNQIDTGDYDVCAAHFGRTGGSGSSRQPECGGPRTSSLGPVPRGNAGDLLTPTDECVINVHQ